MWLYAVDNVRVGSEHVDHLPRPLVPDKHTATVTATQYPVIPPEVGLLDLNTHTHVYTQEKDYMYMIHVYIHVVIHMYHTYPCLGCARNHLKELLLQH